MAGGVFMLTGDDAAEGKIPTGPREQSTINGIPKFKLVPVKRKDGSYANVEFVDIMIPGDNKSMPCRKVTDHLRQKYKYWYDLWRQGLEASPIGTPLESWPSVTPAQIMQLKAQNIFTVEQMADVSDSSFGNIPYARNLKNSAIKWLELKKDSDAIAKQEAENSALKDSIRQMQEQIEALSAANTAKAAKEVDAEPAEKPKRKRRTKAEMEAAKTVAEADDLPSASGAMNEVYGET